MKSRPRSNSAGTTTRSRRASKPRPPICSSKLKSGNPFDALAKADDVTVQTAKDLKRGPVSNGISAKVIDAVFHTANGAFGSAEGDKPTQWVVFRVSDVKTPPLDAKFARRQEARAITAAGRERRCLRPISRLGSKTISAPPSIRPRWRSAVGNTPPPDIASNADRAFGRDIRRALCSGRPAGRMDDAGRRLETPVSAFLKMTAAAARDPAAPGR